ncbi:MAG: LUD domain-containing protein [Nonlabens sp.]
MSLFKKLFKRSNEQDDETGQQSKYMPKEKLPLDELFIEKFQRQGGRFLYCPSEGEVDNFLKDVIEEHDFKNKDVFCLDNALTDRFKDFEINLSKYNINSSFFLTGCEYIIADTGALLFTSNQVKDFKPKELPHTYVVLARMSQLVGSISEGLTGIKLKHKTNIPSNITTLKTFDNGKQVEEQSLLNYGVPMKCLYLILVEDL